MDDASDAVGLNHGATGIRLNLKDVFTSQNSSKQALASVSNKFSTFEGVEKNLRFSNGDWTQTHGSLYTSIRMQKTMMSLLLSLIILVAAFNVISTLVMSVTEKRSDVAILKTFGASPSLISRIFIVQGTIIGVFGILIGLVLGIVLALSIPSVSAWINVTFNLGLFDNYFVESLPSKIRLTDILLILISALIVVLLSTIYPAYSAARTQPVKILKGE